MSEQDFAQLCAELVSLPYVERQQIIVDSTSDIDQLEGDILSVSRNAARYLRFPPGHPREKTLYIGNPVSSIVYYPTAQFHHRTFEHKVSEAVHLLMSLGAIYFKVECVEGWSNNLAAKMNLSTNNDLLHIETEGKAKQETASRILFQATLNNAQIPSLPKDLAWYWDEKNWQNIAEGRLKHDLKSFELDVEYKDDFGVNANLELKVAGLGLNLGGDFEDYRATVWRIAGTFA
jgi:hypothetical protein